MSNPPTLLIASVSSVRGRNHTRGYLAVMNYLLLNARISVMFLKLAFSH